ncbi:hypothetical protein [Paenibacillus pabuli]|uniref:hypothetical protein n=1 Tax=Paenibacillus pabuli TaxID=1472 RepID=UPI001FFF4A77|nr:hypothetical protein [Paenibacillus pabuli]UPK41467.1 hypothetical protein KET34_19605 [Paenibacillus pabuli]
MKKSWFSFLLVFVLMGAFASQVFAANDGTGAPVTGGRKESAPIMGQHQYGELEAHLYSGNYSVNVTLQELKSGGWVSIYTLVATTANPTVKTHYYLEGGKQYRLIVETLGSGWGHLYNYIP